MTDFRFSVWSGCARCGVRALQERLGSDDRNGSPSVVKTQKSSDKVQCSEKLQQAHSYSLFLFIQTTCSMDHQPCISPDKIFNAVRTTLWINSNLIKLFRESAPERCDDRKGDFGESFTQSFYWQKSGFLNSHKQHYWQWWMNVKLLNNLKDLYFLWGF